MARVTYVKKAQKRRDPDGNPKPNLVCEVDQVEIEPGDPYKWIEPKTGAYSSVKRVRCSNCPEWKPWDLSNSLNAQLAQVTHEFEQATVNVESEDDVRQALTEAADRVRQIAEEKRESAQNMEEGFGHATSKSDELGEIADSLDAWADEIEQADVPEFPDPEDGECEDCDGMGSVPAPEPSVTLTLTNRPEVIAFLAGPFVDAHVPEDLGSDVVVIDIIDRTEVVILGDTVTRLAGDFTIGTDSEVRTSFAHGLPPLDDPECEGCDGTGLVRRNEPTDEQIQDWRDSLPDEIAIVGEPPV